eukprot:10971057-Alexandrium_andersonii.AAC.1
MQPQSQTRTARHTHVGVGARASRCSVAIAMSQCQGETFTCAQTEWPSNAAQRLASDTSRRTLNLQR